MFAFAACLAGLIAVFALGRGVEIAPVEVGAISAAAWE